MPRAGVLANDTDVDGDTLTADRSSRGPAHGTLTLNADGSFTYTPAANYNGTDSFTYKANDGTADSQRRHGRRSPSTPVNDAPVAANDAYATNEDTTLTVAAPGVLANDTDVDGDTLTAVAGRRPGRHGTLDAERRRLVHLHARPPTTTAPTRFTYKANDGTADSQRRRPSTITVNAVNDAPVGRQRRATRPTRTRR